MSASKVGRATRADCTVRALSACAEISYQEAHEIAAIAGRKPGRGFSASRIIQAARNAGFRFRTLRYRRVTVERLLREYPTGRFYARKRGHAFAIVDGKVSDCTPPRSIIVRVWRFEGKR